MCDQKFSWAQNLDHHTRPHTGEKQYKCDICDQMCSET